MKTSAFLEQDIFSESPCLGFSPASEQQAEDKGQNEWELRYKADICVGVDRKARQDNMEGSPAKQMENCASRQNYRINEALEENRGIKRKYTDDDEQSKRTMPLEIKGWSSLSVSWGKLLLAGLLFFK